MPLTDSCPRERPSDRIVNSSRVFLGRRSSPAVIGCVRGATKRQEPGNRRERLTAMLSRLFLLACLLASPAALGQTYPDRNVTIVVTSAAGALTDTLTRAVAQGLSEMWKQSVIVENRSGAGYSIAAQSVMRAEHDGYTLPASETGFYTTQPHLYAEGKLAYDAEKDLVPVAGYGTIPTALLVNPSVPVNSVSDLIALAKTKPGAVTFGTAGVGTALHIAGLELENLTGIKMTAVHYRGAAPALSDVIAGHINAVIMGPSVALSSVKAGKLKMLAFGSDKRVPQFPDVPTITETVLGYEANVSFGLFAAAGTPAEIIKKVNADVQKIVSDPEFQRKYLERTSRRNQRRPRQWAGLRCGISAGVRPFLWWDMVTLAVRPRPCALRKVTVQLAIATRVTSHRLLLAWLWTNPMLKSDTRLVC